LHSHHARSAAVTGGAGKRQRRSRLRWHDLRHVAASLRIAEGANVGHVSGLLGHASPAIALQTHAHVLGAAEHDAATRERMEAAFGSILA
jgi:site-specific recombinase XerD